MRRRLAMVYRAAGRALMANGEFGPAKDYVLRMLSTFPWDLKNLAVGMTWMARRANSRMFNL
jgi:hypothetical protein